MITAEAVHFGKKEVSADEYTQRARGALSGKPSAVIHAYDLDWMMKGFVLALQETEATPLQYHTAYDYALQAIRYATEHECIQRPRQREAKAHANASKICQLAGSYYHRLDLDVPSMMWVSKYRTHAQNAATLYELTSKKAAARCWSYAASAVKIIAKKFDLLPEFDKCYALNLRAAVMQLRIDPKHAALNYEQAGDVAASRAKRSKDAEARQWANLSLQCFEAFFAYSYEHKDEITPARMAHAQSRVEKMRALLSQPVTCILAEGLDECCD